MEDAVRALRRTWWSAAPALVLALTTAGCSGSPSIASATPAPDADAVPPPPAVAATRDATPGPGEAAVGLARDSAAPAAEPVDGAVAERAPEEAVDEVAAASPAVAEPAPEPAPELPGTPEQPVRGPEPRGVLGTWLRSVTVDTDEAGTEVMLHGDGQFRYSSFGLHDPSRFVVDLEGVAAAEPWSSIPVGDGPVAQVRAAQFRVEPEPVTRIVVDLEAVVAPEIESLPTGLRISFPRPRTAVEAVAEVEAEAARVPAAPQPQPVPAADPVAPRPVLASTPAEPTPVPKPAPAALPAPAETPQPPEDTDPAPQPRPAPEPAEDPIAEPPLEPAPIPAPTPEPAEVPIAEPSLEPAPAPAPAPALAPAPEPTRDPIAEPAAEPPSSPQTPVVVEAPDDDVVLLSNEDTVTPQDRATSGFAPRSLARGEREYHGEPISVTITDADLKSTLRDFAELSGLNIVVHPDVSGTVTVHLESVPWDQALEQILKMNDLAYRIEGNIMRVAPRAQFEEEARAAQELRQIEAMSVPLQTVLKRISYGTAREVAAVLRGETGGAVLSARGSVVVDDRTNTLIIRELPRYMDTVLAIVEHLDAPEPQVHIEARIVETNKDFSRTLGIQWGFAGVADAAHGNTTGLEFPNNIRGSGSVNLPRGGENGIIDLAMGNVLNTFTLDATLQAAENEGLVNILSTPSVTVLNNEQAEIQSGISIPIQTVVETTISVQFVNATLRLLVTPHVTADGTVLLDINIQKRQPRVDLLLPNARNVPISTKEARTRVIVADGGTTVIGGIYEVETSEAEDRVPGLANIPLLGHLFRNKDRRESNEELLIFITPRVLKL